MSISRDAYKVNRPYERQDKNREYDYTSNAFPRYAKSNFGGCLLETDHYERYSLNKPEQKDERAEGQYKIVLDGNVSTLSIGPLVSPAELIFYDLVEKWRDETSGHSSLTIITTNRHYLRIIGMGPVVIPMILRELQLAPAPWFVALQALTGEYEIGKQYPGRFGKIAAEWVKWGREKNLL